MQRLPGQQDTTAAAVHFSSWAEGKDDASIKQQVNKFDEEIIQLQKLIQDTIRLPIPAPQTVEPKKVEFHDPYVTIEQVKLKVGTGEYKTIDNTKQGIMLFDPNFKGLLADFIKICQEAHDNEILELTEKLFSMCQHYQRIKNDAPTNDIQRVGFALAELAKIKKMYLDANAPMQVNLPDAGFNVIQDSLILSPGVYCTKITDPDFDEPVSIIASLQNVLGRDPIPRALTQTDSEATRHFLTDSYMTDCHLSSTFQEGRDERHQLLSEIRLLIYYLESYLYKTLDQKNEAKVQKNRERVGNFHKALKAINQREMATEDLAARFYSIQKLYVPIIMGLGTSGNPFEKLLRENLKNNINSIKQKTSGQIKHCLTQLNGYLTHAGEPKHSIFFLQSPLDKSIFLIRKLIIDLNTLDTNLINTSFVSYKLHRKLQNAVNQVQELLVASQANSKSSPIQNQKLNELFAILQTALVGAPSHPEEDKAAARPEPIKTSSIAAVISSATSEVKISPQVNRPTLDIPDESQKTIAIMPSPVTPHHRSATAMKERPTHRVVQSTSSIIEPTTPSTPSSARESISSTPKNMPRNSISSHRRSSTMTLIQNFPECNPEEKEKSAKKHRGAVLAQDRNPKTANLHRRHATIYETRPLPATPKAGDETKEKEQESSFISSLMKPSSVGPGV